MRNLQVMAMLLAFGAPAFGTETAFELVENHIYVPVTVAGQERQWILDTGAGASVIDAAYAEELGLERIEGNVMAMGAGGTVDATLVELPGLSVGDAELGERMIVALDVAALLRGRVGTEPAGILGYDFLARHVTRLDYAGRVVEFYDPDSFEYRGEGGEVPMKFERNIPAVQLAVEDSIVGWWRLDTGASFPVFHVPGVAEFGLAERTGVERPIAGVGGTKRGRLVRFDKVELAGYVVEDPVMVVPLDSIRGPLASAGYVGAMGGAVLRNFTLYLDYPGRRLFVEPSAEFGREFATDRSGLSLVSDSSGLRVFHVAPGTPADEAGFRVDDAVMTIDARTPAEFGGVGAARELLRAEPGTGYTFRVRRGDDELDLGLTLRDLFAD